MGSYNDLSLVLWTDPNPKGKRQVKASLYNKMNYKSKAILDCNLITKEGLKIQTKLEMDFSCFKGRNDRKFILLSPDEDTVWLPSPGTEVCLRNHGEVKHQTCHVWAFTLMWLHFNLRCCSCGHRLAKLLQGAGLQTWETVLGHCGWKTHTHTRTERISKSLVLLI